MKYRSLMNYLSYYRQFHNDIILVYRGDLSHNWARRCVFGDDKFESHVPYNHRSILTNEVVIEYDEPDKELNERLATKVCDKLKACNISYSKWHSGNKSVHIHFLVNMRSASNISLVKNTVMRWFGTFYVDTSNRIYKWEKNNTRKIIPDLRLAALNHLVRAEYGVHEKTKRNKCLIYKSPDYPKVSEIPDEIWSEYTHKQRAVVLRRVSSDINSIKEHPGFKYIATSHEFREAEDGRERALFILIHALKEEWVDKKDEFVTYLWDWYRYSGGYKLTRHQVAHKINYHWKRSYNIKTVLNELLESIGKEDLIKY